MERSEQLHADVAGGGPGTELQQQNAVGGDFLQGSQYGEGLAEARVSVNARHGSGFDGVGDVLACFKECLGAHNAGVGEVEVEVGFSDGLVVGGGRHRVGHGILLEGVRLDRTGRVRQLVWEVFRQWAGVCCAEVLAGSGVEQVDGVAAASADSDGA